MNPVDNGSASEAAAMAGLKRCSKCTEFKPVSAFGRDRKTRDGLRTDCRECRQNETQAAAYGRALRRLREQHLDEFQRYYDDERG
jgi:hypothetical protein